MARSIVEELFPRMSDHIEEVHCLIPPLQQAHIEEVTLEEIAIAARSIGPNKAPGPDMYFILAFPCARKSSQAARIASSFRPICLIDSAGKLLEKVVCSRLERAIAEAGDLSLHQYGFRKARSTTDAVGRVVDITSRAIARTLVERRLQGVLPNGHAGHQERRMVRNYFEERLLLYDTQAGTEQYEVSGGVPQGSVLGPLLWNAMYDGILRLSLPHGVHVVGFADDVAVLVVAKDLAAVETTCNLTIALIQQWLELTHDCFREHLAYMNSKAASSNRALSRMMLNTPRTQAMATTSTIECDEIVSDDAAHVIAGIAPFEYLAEERSTYHLDTHGRGMEAADKRQVRKACKLQSLRKWQQRWDTSPKGRWTHQLIPSIEAWVDRKHGQVNFYLTQLLAATAAFAATCIVSGMRTQQSAAPVVPAAPVADAARIAHAASIAHAARIVHAVPVVHAAPVIHAARIAHAASMVRAAPVINAAPVVHAPPDDDEPVVSHERWAVQVARAEAEE
ncbi:uncharacterized protein LOC121405423 [Drosophila obscura]|uniref:uncharacterized protein LOC121405423 n=1 Tax=Drosophila obscura TaxID=7282 RepID=UPI001BB21BCB|nr:uncharacterized protein LOC121405423 [Drosophila obscura]